MILKIIVPNLCTKNVLSFSNTLHDCEKNDTYFFDVSKVSNYEPFSMLFTAAVIRQFCEKRDLMPWDIQLRFLEDKDYSYACHMGFFKAAGFEEGKNPGEAHGSYSYIPLTKINIRDLNEESMQRGEFLEQGDIIEKKSAELARILAQSNDEMKKLFQFLIREAIRNIPEHAGTNDVWICGQYWWNRGIAEIAILDEGIGVFESLNKNIIHKSYISNNEDALRWAIKPGVSRAFNPAKEPNLKDPWANSGYGLHMISEICKNTKGGWLTFVSNNNCLRIYSNSTSLETVNFRGTALGIRVGTKNIKNAQAMIDEARLKGEATAKNIKNAFKSASLPSKGLMLE
ncbi:MAG: ATP-binding protein [Clostridia bacterium]|nr:ATP-binding protein [Clostridia bacterium]